MRFLTFEENGVYQLGLKTNKGVIDVAKAIAIHGLELPATPDQFYRAGNTALDGFVELAKMDVDASALRNEQTLTLGPCVPNPGKILCVGLNYRQHAIESKMKIPELPVLFSKFNNTIAAPDEGIPVNAGMPQLDYESELVVIIGKTAKNVNKDEALDYVLGYCNGNDISDRFLQFLSGQWLLGKTPDKFMPIGPYVVTADEVGDPQNLSVKGWLNGELRQNSNTSDMIFTVAEVIAYVSQYMTLNRGDIISTGTPEGVIFGMEPKKWMQVGDEYTVEIGNLGRLSNTLVEG